MRILFYSESCDFCVKLLSYIDTNKLGQYFKIICIDKTKNIPKNITVVPTIIDTTVEAPLEGKKAFEYVINQKYFNHPTNNIEYTKEGVPKPTIDEDAKANASKSGAGFIYVDKDIERKFNDKEERQNFDQVFNRQSYNNVPTASNAINRPNTANQQTQQINQRQQQTIQQQQQYDRVNQLIAQRNIQDKKVQALMRLRGN